VYVIKHSSHTVCLSFHTTSHKSIHYLPVVTQAPPSHTLIRADLQVPGSQQHIKTQRCPPYLCVPTIVNRMQLSRLPPSPQMRKFQPISLRTSPWITRNGWRLFVHDMSTLHQGLVHSWGQLPHLGNNGNGNCIVGSIRTSLRIGKFESLSERRSSSTHVVESQGVTDPIRLQKANATASERDVISFVVVYTMIFFNGCK